MLPQYDPIPDVHKIAVLRANAIGDFIFCLPALEALRAAYPAAEIVLLGQHWHRGFLAGRPGPIDRVVVVPPSRGVNDSAGPDEDPDELERFFAVMAREQFDLALQLHGGGRHSNPFVRRLGARMTIGLKAPEAVPLDRWLPYCYSQSEIIRYLEVVALAGAQPVVLEPRLAIIERDRADARAVVPEGGPPLVLLHPGASDPRRRWPAEKFAAVGDALAATGLRVVVNGIQREHSVAQAVVDAMRTEGLNLCGRLSLEGLAGLLPRCAVVVSNDSGPLHLAAAVGTATVGIYWLSNLFVSGQLTRARHRPLVSWRLQCPTCGVDCLQSSCNHPASFVADVPSAEVIAAARELLATAPPGRPERGGTLLNGHARP